MDGFGDDGLLPLFSQPDPFSPVHAAEPSSRPSASAAARRPLDLNSEWPSFGEYQSLLQSAAVGGTEAPGGSIGGGGFGGSPEEGGRRPPLPLRGGLGGANRTLGLRAARRGGSTSPAPRARRSPAAGRGAASQPSAGGRRRHPDSDSPDDVEEVPPAPPREKNSEYRRFEHGPPPYLDKLERLFDGVAVDGSTAFVPGQASTEEEEEEDDEELDGLNEDSPASQSSLKRSSSTNTTATSPNKKIKSPIVRMMKQWFDKSTATSEQQTKLLQEMSSMRLKVHEEMKRAEEERTRAEEERIRAEQERDNAEINKAIQLDLEDGVDETSAEYYALSNICAQKESRQFYLKMKSAQGRLAYLQRWCKANNLS
ncbi:hypothetical protein ACP70R_029231 [Stipagrostis hirtigluma subsp. patula]